MKVEMLTGHDATERVVNLVKGCDKLHIAVAWAGPNPVIDEILKSPNKWGRIVIGTHMYQTSPETLKELKNTGEVRYRSPSGPLFHPKIYIFESKQCITAVVGSHNLTGGAFRGKNIEVSVLYEGTDHDTVISDLKEFIQKFWKTSDEIDDAFLYAYAIQHKLNQKSLKQISSFIDIPQPNPASSPQHPLLLTWDAYVKSVKDDTYRTLAQRLAVLNRAARLFVEKQSLAKMTLDERRAIAATFAPNEATFEGLTWAWFGNMFGFGVLKNIINESPQALSDALDCIPPRGEVSETDYQDFVALFNNAFEGRSRKGGVPPASRLLSLKRPDVFIPINSGNGHDICAAFRTRYTTLSLDNYWERLIVKAMQSPWWQGSRPRMPEDGTIWDNRAALLDCIYYVPKNAAKDDEADGASMAPIICGVSPEFSAQPAYLSETN